MRTAPHVVAGGNKNYASYRIHSPHAKGGIARSP